MSWKAGQILSIRLTTPSPAVKGAFLAAFLFSVDASFNRWQAGCEPLHPNALARSRVLNVQVYFAAIDSRYFGIRRRLWPHENGNDVRLQPYSRRRTVMQLRSLASPALTMAALVRSS